MSGPHAKPVRGLPGRLPPGEHILWQGSPMWMPLARRLLLVRWIAAYFAGLVAWGLVSSSAPFGAAITLGLGIVACSLIALFAWGVQRTTIYTITNRRIVIRFGIALSKCVNIPFRTIGSVALSPGPGESGAGDLSLTLTEPLKLGFLQMWPHVRPTRVKEPVPVLRMVPGASHVGALLTRALVDAVPGGRRVAPLAPAAASGEIPLGAFARAA